MKKPTHFFSLLCLTLAGARPGRGTARHLPVPDFCSIAEYIGGDRARRSGPSPPGKDNSHFVEVLPSYMVMVSRADL